MLTRITLMLILWPALLFGAETWQFSANTVTSIQNETENRTVLDGNARIASENFTILAKHLELIGSDYEHISGDGGVSLVDTEKGITVESGRIEYDRKAKIIHFRERVTLVNEEEGIVIRCESLDLWEEEDLLVMQIMVRLIKDQTICRGEFATFFREENLLEISGRPVVWRDDDEYRADRIHVNLDTDEIIMEGTVEGALISEEED